MSEQRKETDLELQRPSQEAGEYSGRELVTSLAKLRALIGDYKNRMSSLKTTSAPEHELPGEAQSNPGSDNQAA